MFKSIAQVVSLLDRLIDWFIPAEIAAERESRQRARMFLISHLLGPFIGNVVPGALFFLEPRPGFDVAVLTASITSFWVFPFVLRALGRYNLLVLLSVQNLTFCILWGCYFTGGVHSPTLPWVLTIPLLAFFYLGSTASLRMVVLGLFAANFAVFFGLCVLGNPTPSASTAALQGLGIVSTLAASVYVTMMALYYAKILASGVELEAEMKGHLATATELRRATAEAERAGAAKAEFLAKMSHELRTPLNAVIGYSQMLLEDARDEGDTESAEDLERIHSAGHHLLRLVSEVLDLSKIEAGKMELTADNMDAGDLLRTAVEPFRDLAANNRDALSLELADDLGAIVCDSAKVRQVLTQIIDNAIKFTQDGKIVVSAQRQTADPVDQLVISVKDTGIGIAEEAIPILFENFSVGEDSSASKYGGTGLGLALSQKLCHLMGGGVSVESTLGAGSCFTVMLPVSPPTAPARTAGEEADPADPIRAEDLAA